MTSFTVQKVSVNNKVYCISLPDYVCCRCEEGCGPVCGSRQLEPSSRQKNTVRFKARNHPVVFPGNFVLLPPANEVAER